MDLELNDDQEFFRETTRKFLAAEAPIPTVRDLESDPAGFSPDYWRRGAELGWTSSTGDPDGELVETGRVPERLELPTGDLMQRPPAYSAVKVGGDALAGAPQEHGR